MQKKRKIAMVVNKFSSHQAAEEADDKYWAEATMEDRLKELMHLRMIFLGDKDREMKMHKVVVKRSLYEEE